MNTDLIQKIILNEWYLFTNTKNINHRSPCQDRPDNFLCSRAAYWSMYNEDILKSYCNDLSNALANNINLVTQKYAYMMYYTDREGYKKIEHLLMPVTKEKIHLLNLIMDLYLEWEKEISQHCPNLDNHNRSLYASEDSRHNTSVETYMRGELCSYSESTLKLIVAYFYSCKFTAVNPVKVYLENLKTVGK